MPAHSSMQPTMAHMHRGGPEVGLLHQQHGEDAEHDQHRPQHDAAGRAMRSRSRATRAATKTIMANLAGSAGWIWKAPAPIHRWAPLTLMPTPGDEHGEQQPDRAEHEHRDRRRPAVVVDPAADDEGDQADDQPHALLEEHRERRAAERRAAATDDADRIMTEPMRLSTTTSTTIVAPEGGLGLGRTGGSRPRCRRGASGRPGTRRRRWTAPVADRGSGAGERGSEGADRSSSAPRVRGPGRRSRRRGRRSSGTSRRTRRPATAGRRRRVGPSSAAAVTASAIESARLAPDGRRRRRPATSAAASPMATTARMWSAACGQRRRGRDPCCDRRR